MKKSIIYFLYGLLFILVYGCSDDEAPTIMDDDNPPVETPCLAALDSLTIPAVNVDTMLNFDDCPISWVEFYPEKYRYSFPSFNPNNTEEIAFVRLENGTNEFRLCILSLCSGDLKVLDVKAFKDVDWGTNGWILFRKTDLQLWKVRPDGSGLAQLTFSGENSNPIWNASGEKIAYALTNTGEFFILNDEGAILDTVEPMQYRSAYDWSSTDKLITPFEPGSPDDIYYFDLNLDTLVKVDEEGNGSYIYDGEWGEGERLYWLAQYQLAYNDIETKERTVLFSLPNPNGFHNRFYRSLTISPGNKYIVLNREDWKQLNECDVEVVHSLYIMGMDGTGERKILVPE